MIIYNFTKRQVPIVAIVVITFLFIVSSYCLASKKVDEKDSTSNQIVSGDSIKREAELKYILELLPPDKTSFGRVSFLDKTFKDWLQRTGELPPNFDPMPSIPFLPDPLLIDQGGKNIPVSDSSQWKEKRQWMKEQLAYYITGTCPPKPDNLQYKILSEEKDGNILLRHVELTFGPNHQAKLAVDLLIPPGKGPFPVFLTNWNHREWTYIAVRRGYIGCVYAGADVKDDTEEYSQIWAGQYDFTRLMRRAYGASRAVDYLYTLPNVDKKKIGITGHSRNGKTSLMAAAFDERIGACIPSSGGAGAEIPWRYCAHKYDVEDIALLSCAQPAWLHPRLRFFIGRENKLPVDQNHFMALIAPRGLMLSTAITEAGSNPWGIEQAFHSSKKVFKFLNAEENLAITCRYGLHGVNARDIEEYIDFFDYVFKRSNRKPENRLNCDYSFEEWCKLSGEKINPLDYEVKSQKLLQNGKSRVESIKEWENIKKGIKKQIQWGLGIEPPGVTNPGPGSLEKGGIGEKKIGSFLVRPDTTSQIRVMNITPYDGFGDYLFGYLYYPTDNNGVLKNKDLPVVIFLHEYDYSKGFSSLKYDHDTEAIFQTLVKMGFGVFSFDMLGFGNRLQEATHFYDRYPNWSKMGKMVSDVRGAVDAISNLDFVDKTKIFTAGYSLGGTVSLISAAMDERIAGVVSIAGFTPMRTNTPERGTEGIKSFSHLHGLVPRLGFFVGNENRIPFDFPEVLACIAPRPVLVIAPKFDKDAHMEDVDSCVKQVGEIYKLLDAKANIQLFAPLDYNRFSPLMRKEMYNWFKMKL